MKKLFLMLLFILSSLNPSFSEVKKNENFVTIIPIQGAIEPGLLYVVRRGLDHAVRTKSKAIITSSLNSLERLQIRFKQ